MSALAVGLVLLAPARCVAAEVPATIDPAAPCATSTCHADVVEHRLLHWPDLSGVGQCQECHEPDGDDHEFSTDTSPEACWGCHQELRRDVRTATTTHDAMEDGCLDCHDPHGGAGEALLVGGLDDDVTPLCFDCHDEDILQGEFEHGPAGAGACNMCHDPHASSINPLLKREGAALCGECHDDVVERVEKAEFAHDPAEDSCTDCHDPHSGPYPRMLPAEGRALCGECHDDIVEIAENSDVDHAPTVTKDECLNCHRPHAAEIPANLREPQTELCLGCHDRRLRSGDGRLVNLKRWLSRNEVWHEPLREDGCTECHGPHGSENTRLLKRAFPSGFYAGFETETYALCLSCHEAALITSKRTRSVTGFRDGSRNLHFLHVNKPKGRTCRACHEFHAGPHPVLIRETTRYGRWMMPLEFEKTETGGSCQPGCHSPESYDREAADTLTRD